MEPGDRLVDRMTPREVDQDNCTRLTEVLTICKGGLQFGTREVDSFQGLEHFGATKVLTRQPSRSKICWSREIKR